MKNLNKRSVMRPATCCAIMSTVFFIAACAALPVATGKKAGVSLLLTGQDIPPRTGQVLVVTDESFLFFTRTRMYFLEQSGGGWVQIMEPIDALIGRNGLAAPGEKREGDGKTPSGLFRLGTAFGYTEKIDTKMPYRQALADDIWVDDPAAPDYNRWVKKQLSEASSYEVLRRDDHLYRLAIVIEYNTDPVIKGYGSAIFLHLWAGPHEPTAGCVAVSKENMLKLLSRLDPERKPVMIINPDHK